MTKDEFRVSYFIMAIKLVISTSTDEKSVRFLKEAIKHDEQLRTAELSDWTEVLRGEKE